jgi:hypothetical protein
MSAAQVRRPRRGFICMMKKGKPNQIQSYRNILENPGSFLILCQIRRLAIIFFLEERVDYVCFSNLKEVLTWLYTFIFAASCHL